jgi:hypothetical protein
MNDGKQTGKQEFKNKTPQQEPYINPLDTFRMQNCCKCRYLKTGECGSPSNPAQVPKMQLCLDAAILAAFNTPVEADPTELVQEAFGALGDMMKKGGVNLFNMDDDTAPADEHKPRAGLSVKKLGET